MRAAFKYTGIVVAGSVAGICLTFMSGYLVLLFHPDLDAAHFGF